MVSQAHLVCFGLRLRFDNCCSIRFLPDGLSITYNCQG